MRFIYKAEDHMQEYIKADQALHWLSQVPARINRSFVQEKSDDSHTNLYFDCLIPGIYGRWFSTPAGKMIFCLDLDTLSFKCLDQNRKLLLEKSALHSDQEELLAHTEAFLKDQGMQTERLNEAMHFTIPDYGFESIAQDHLSVKGLRSWKYYRELANRACFDMLGYFQAEAEVRIWPHHFDTGIYVQLNKGLGIGFGLAMEDPMVGEPYFYLSAYAGDSVIDYADMNALSTGRWETKTSWKGAVLPLSALHASSTDEAMKVIRRFIKETTTLFIYGPHISTRQ